MFPFVVGNALVCRPSIIEQFKIARPKRVRNCFCFALIAMFFVLLYFVFLLTHNKTLLKVVIV